MNKYNVKELVDKLNKGESLGEYNIFYLEREDGRVFSVSYRDNKLVMDMFNEKYSIELGDNIQNEIEKGLVDYDEKFNKKSIELLKELQYRLNHQDNLATAQPVYWVIKDRITNITMEGNQSDYMFYGDDDYTAEELLEDLYEELEVSHSQGIKEYLVLRRDSKFAQFILDDEKVDGYDVLDILEEDFSPFGFDLYAMMEEREIEPLPVSESYQIVSGTLFLTHESAKEHLELNAHHYSSEAFAYAVSAFRSPEVEVVWEILRKLKL